MVAIRTSDGFLVDPFNPRVEDVKPGVFIHAISCINRYTGHAAWPYSVGQHTRNLITAVPFYLRRAAMVHDWSEAWFNDLASPVKRELPEYREAEHAAMLFIGSVMGVPEAAFSELDAWDKAIYINERNALFPVRHGPGMGDERKGLRLSAGLFQEEPWRAVKVDLTYWYRQLFSEGPQI